MIKVQVEARVLYTCFLNEKDSEKVKKYAEKNDMDLIEAVQDLYENCKIDLYTDSVESDFSTEDYIYAEEEQNE